MRAGFLARAALVCCAALRAFDAAALESSPPLIDAVRNGDRTAALELIVNHADVNATEVDGTTALHWAVYSSQETLITALLMAG
ncbi:MAG TPA: ankyrin repeat domain-containing protein, partial [Gammaproteobacteria bacterium]|nr:ankyrin repeat domain-containing protein [Gammaproteobacteria bacterium]